MVVSGMPERRDGKLYLPAEPSAFDGVIEQAQGRVAGGAGRAA
jgi:hypothetical protein